MADRPYAVVVLPMREEDGEGYVALVPDLFGCMAVGDTREEAVLEIGEAILEWIDEAHRLGRDVPQPGAIGEEHRKMRAALRQVNDRQDALIKKQSALIESLRKALDEATAALSDAHQRDEVSFEWNLDCDVDLPALIAGRHAPAH